MEYNFGDDNIRSRETSESKNTITPVDHDKVSKTSSFSVEKTLYLLLPYLHIKWNYRIYYFLLQVMFSSYFGPGGGKVLVLKFLVGKNSFFNEVFVKFGWGWTLSLILLLRLACMPLHSNWRQHLRNLLIRVSSLTLFFYLFCQVCFPFIEEYTGRCVKQGIIQENIGKKRCVKMGNSFYSFDISGHSYLMIYCILSIMEESKELIYVLCLGQLVRKSFSTSAVEKDSSASSFPEDEVQNLGKKYSVILPFIVGFSVCTFCLSLLWDIMLVITTLYYHTFIEKFLGTSLAIAMWYIQYHVYFLSYNVL
ncbi:UNVERIFIED_CONTAM: hypothetical protein RMT77_009770 [Armadillidium vulgare]